MGCIQDSVRDDGGDQWVGLIRKGKIPSYESNWRSNRGPADITCGRPSFIPTFGEGFKCKI